MLSPLSLINLSRAPLGVPAWQHTCRNTFQELFRRRIYIRGDRSWICGTGIENNDREVDMRTLILRISDEEM